MATNKPGNDVAEFEDNNVVSTVPATAVSNNPLEPKSIYYSGTIESFEDRLKFAADVLGNSSPIAEHGGETITLVNFAFQPVKVKTDDGEELDDVRTYLIGVNSDGENIAYRATSIGIRTSLNDIISVIGEPQSWPEPIQVKINAVSLPNARRTYRLSIVL